MLPEPLAIRISQNVTEGHHSVRAQVQVTVFGAALEKKVLGQTRDTNGL